MKNPLPLLLLLLLFSFTLQAQTLTGRVVSVADGDTITILDASKTQYKIRLNGIDCPEKRQDYGQKAKQFTSDFCYGKTVTVHVRDIDKYKRYVGDVEVNGKNLNKSLVASGLAWHYKQYSKDKELAALETRAKEQGIGLWAMTSPIAPWDWRRGGKSASGVKKSSKSTSGGSNMVYITKSGKKFHADGCSSLSKSKIPISRSEATARGYTPCGKCKP